MADDTTISRPVKSLASGSKETARVSVSDRAGNERETPLPDRIEAFVKAVSASIVWRHQHAQRAQSELKEDTRSPTLPGTPEATARLEKRIQDQFRSHDADMDRWAEASSMGRGLITDMEAAGVDSWPVFRVLHFLADGGGPDNLNPEWPDLKTGLLAAAARLRARSKAATGIGDGSAEALARFVAGQSEQADNADDPVWWTIGQFNKTIQGRVKKAALPNRKRMPVRIRRMDDGTRQYSAADARQWWPRDMSKAR